MTSCTIQDSVQYCTPQYSIPAVPVATASAGASLPGSYTGCHTHGEETFCVGPNGEDLLIKALSPNDEHDEHGDEHGDEHDEHKGSKENCHFHAGVEHCTGSSAGASTSGLSCARRQRDYNIPLRIGATFTILIASAIAVFGPIFLKQFTKISTTSTTFTIIKQFGTGVIIATAYVHLLTHAQLLFGSDCVGDLDYEGTATAIAMAGAFLSFSLEYLGARFIARRRAKNPLAASPSASVVDGKGAEDDDTAIAHAGHAHGGVTPGGKEDKLSVAVMEIGIIFHSILIGITLVVAGDSGFTTLFIVIIFHQMFEGLALGARIASLPTDTRLLTKLFMGLAFATITPIGMAIGIGVRNEFNGNDKATIIALATLDALSAGVLVWVALVEMWVADWLYGDLKNSGVWKTTIAMGALVAGMVLMGLLGKWA
ncbi:Zip-domain-containing protein [Choiromyces venosus 120613-1]|uniref:Zip-domain-containing protein n=1 Tax=Choiromyces venosus 120613-1 TaxID=1336337 RepID=A0A3N4K0C3_9PEZI|nr:Zip-domain-containing protein [Choiromyces venosus 120613-1]